MKRLSAFIAGLLILALIPGSYAQQPVTVIGPVTPGNCAAFNSNTVIKDGGACGGGGSFGTMALQNANAVAITGGTITGMPTPVNPTDVANKSYVDAVAIGLTIHSQVAWATTTVLPNSPTYSNGSSGVGATLTAGSNAAIAVDGGNPIINDRVLVKNQAAPAQNGVYTVTTVGDGSTAWVLTRATDFDVATAGNMAEGAYFFVYTGTANIGSAWVFITPPAITIGTTALAFVQFSGSSGGLSPIANNNLLANTSGSPASPVATTPTALWDSFCSSTVGQFWVRLSSAWGCVSAGYANPVWWGADPTGVSDSTSAFNSALAVSSNIQFPPGTFKFLSAITYNIPSGTNSLTIKGAGQDVTSLVWATTSGLNINYSSTAHSFHLRDITISTASSGAAPAITLTQTVCLNNFAQSDFYRVTIRGDNAYSTATHYWSQAISIIGVSGIVYDGLTIYGGAGFQGAGINIAGNPSGCGTTLGYSIFHYISKSTFLGLAFAVIAGEYSQGVTLTQSNIQNSDVGVYVAPGTAGNLLELMVSNNQIAVAQTPILIASAYSLSTFTGNLLTPTSGFAGINITTPGSGVMTVTGNIIACNSTTSTTAAFIDANYITFVGNSIFNCGIGVDLEPATVGNVVNANVILGAPTPVNDTGSGNQISENNGYNPVGLSYISVGASPFVYISGSSPETVYIFNGAFSTVSQGSFFVCSGSTSCSVNLDPHTSLTVTYTGTPVMAKQIH